MPNSMVRLSAGRESMSDAGQALAFLAGLRDGVDQIVAHVLVDRIDLRAELGDVLAELLFREHGEELLSRVASVAGVATLCGVHAAVAPARRAARLDPAQAIRL